MSENPIFALKGDASLIRSMLLEEVLKRDGDSTEEEKRLLRLIELNLEQADKVGEEGAKVMRQKLLDRLARANPKVKAKFDAI